MTETHTMLCRTRLKALSQNGFVVMNAEVGTIAQSRFSKLLHSFVAISHRHEPLLMGSQNQVGGFMRPLQNFMKAWKS